MNAIGGSFFTLEAIYTDNTKLKLSPVASGYSNRQHAFTDTAGTVCHIVADGYNATTGDILLKVRQGPFLHNLLLLSFGAWSANIALTGNLGETWTIKRAIAMTGPCTNLNSVSISSDGAGQFQDGNPPATSALYRAWISSGGGSK